MLVYKQIISDNIEEVESNWVYLLKYCTYVQKSGSISCYFILLYL